MGDVPSGPRPSTASHANRVTHPISRPPQLSAAADDPGAAVAGRGRGALRARALARPPRRTSQGPHTTHHLPCCPSQATQPHFRVSYRVVVHGQVKVVCGKLNTAAAAIGAAFVHTDYAELYCTHATQVGTINATPSPRCLPLTIFSLGARGSLDVGFTAASGQLRGGPERPPRALPAHRVRRCLHHTHMHMHTLSLPGVYRPCPRNDLALNFLL